MAPPVLTDERRRSEADLLAEEAAITDEMGLPMNPLMLVLVLLIVLLGVWGLIWGPLAAL